MSRRESILRRISFLDFQTFFLLFFLILRTALTTATAASHHSETTNLQRLSRAHLEFALSLFRNLAKETKIEHNVIISPHSIATILSQLWMGSGSGSRTEAELEDILHYKDGGLSPTQVHDAFKSSLYTLEDPDYRNVLQGANAVFIQAGLPLLPSFEKSLKENYNTTIDEVDFEHGETVATSIINRWVNKQTNGQIPHLLESPIQSQTRLLLINALALRAFWKNSFDPTLTVSNGKFYTSSKTKFQIPMMSGRFNVHLGSSSELNSSLLELPFRGKRLSMFILLPNSDSHGRNLGNLTHLEENLNAENLKKLFATLREESNVQVKLPKLRISHSAPLVETLTKMGLIDLFDPIRANLTKVSNATELHVSSIFHKTVIELHEEGAQIASVTATEIQRNHDVARKYFEVNRPFVFFIWDYHNGGLLFIGRVSYPEHLTN